MVIARRRIREEWPMADTRFCPRCGNRPLRRRKLKDSRIEVDFCEKCRGAWFERRELEKALDVAMKDLRIPEYAGASTRPCPDCAKALREFDYPQTYVKVDMCSSCLGIWLDPGELREIKLVREHLKNEGDLEEYDEIPGLRGMLIRWINSTLDDAWALNKT